MEKTRFVKKVLLIGLGFAGLYLSANASADTLRGALIQTLQGNPNILASEKDRYAIGEELRQAKAGYLPTLDATAGYGYEHTDNPFTQSNFDGSTTTRLMRKEAGLAANEMLFDGFDTPNEVNRNQARVCSANYKLWGTAQDTALNAVEAYLKVRTEQELVQDARSNVGVHQSVFGLIKQRNESGVDQSADVDQTQGRLSLAQTNLKAAQANLDDTESNYLQIVGSMPHNLSAPGPIDSRYLPKTEAQAIQMAIANHPILKSAKQDMLAACAQHKSSLSKNYPRFDLQLKAQRDKDIDGLEGRNYDDQAMVRMNYNLYHGGADKARQDQTAYLYQESAEIMHKTYRQVVNNVQLSWNDWQVAQKRLPLLRQHRDAAAKTFQAYKQQFLINKRTLLDSLDAQNEYFDANRAYTQGQFDVEYGKYRVLNAVGNLVQAEHLNLPHSDANA
jgi:adhesin transport system outer membrane protein